MASIERIPDSGNALESLLKRSIRYGKTAVIPYDLVQFGLYGSSTIILAGFLALILPSAASIRDSGFYLVLGNATASVVTLMRVAAIPAIIAGGALLMIDAGLLVVRSSIHWRYVIVGQAIVGGIGGVVCAVFIALVVLNLAIWVTLIVCAVALCLVVIGLVAGGG